MSADDVKWFLVDVAPYASLFAVLSGLLLQCWFSCEKWRDRNK